MNKQLIKAITTALQEDIGSGDVTTLSIVSKAQKINGRFLAKAEGVIAGLEIAAETFRQIDPTLTFTTAVADGDCIKKGDIIATISGSAQAILQGERVALNFLQRMSGIATLTRQFVNATSGTDVRILDTRKTVPGLRMADKLAVKLGGGTNHRMGLFDMALIKENHIAAAGGLKTAVLRVKESYPEIPIEVEVTNLEELEEALRLPIDRIMLDNMSLAEMETAVSLTNGKIPLEASGNVSLETVHSIAQTGVDYISSGALTHSVTALDISLLLN